MRSLRDFIRNWRSGSVSPDVDNSSYLDILSKSSRRTSTSDEMEKSRDTVILDGSVVYDSDSSDAEYERFLEEEFKDTIFEYASALYSKNINGLCRYLSHIIVPVGHDGVVQCVRELKQLIDKYPPNHFYIVASHDNHVHVGHICANRNQSCRCGWLQRSVFFARHKQRGVRRVTRVAVLQPKDYGNILRYLCETVLGRNGKSR